MIVPPLPVSILIDGVQLVGWTSYTITPSSLLEPVGAFELVMPFNKQAWDLVETEARCQIALGGVIVLTGIIEEADGDEQIMVRGRSLVGRLVQESAPSLRFEGLSLSQLVAKLAAPWFSSVTLSNERNRRLIRGKGRKVAAATEPLRIDPAKGGAVAEPGQMRWTVIQELLRQAGCLAWSSGDGRELVVGKPNHDQAPQWRFFNPRAGSARGAESTVLGMKVRRSTADRYSRVIVTGSGRGTDANYGPAVAARYGEALDGPDAEGVGGDFTAPKRLVIHEPVRSIDEARQIARQELARRAAHATVVECSAPGHGQVVLPGLPPTIFCADTIASVEDERTGTRGPFLVAGCTFKSDRNGGEVTDLQLLRRGVELAAS